MEKCGGRVFRIPTPPLPPLGVPRTPLLWIGAPQEKLETLRLTIYIVNRQFPKFL